VAEHHMARLFAKAADLRIFVNMMQNTAISFTICVGNVPDRIERFIREVSDEFKVKSEEGLELITIRHYTPETIENLKKGKMVLFEERIRNTMQLVVKNIPPIERKAVDEAGSKSK
jgi:aspartate kinase